jgi:predicted  nucleic acid-binding Zn-ribbon protein
MKITTHDLTIILQSAKVVHCRTCSRILYLGEGAVPDRGAAPEPGEE